MKVKDYLLENMNDIADLPIIVNSDIGIVRYYDSVAQYVGQSDFIDCFDYLGASVQLDLNGNDDFIILYTKTNYKEV